MNMTEAEKFYKEHKDYCNPNPMTGDYVIEPEDLFRIMEDYHQHKVNNGVLDDVRNCDCLEEDRVEEDGEIYCLKCNDKRD